VHTTGRRCSTRPCSARSDAWPSRRKNAALFGDDTAFQAALKGLDPGDPAVFAGQLASFGDWAGAQQAALAHRFVEVAATEGPRAARAG